MTELIESGAVYHFEGLSLTPTTPGLTRPAGTIPDKIEPTALGNILVGVRAVTWTGDLEVIRGHINPDGTGEPIFPDESHITTIPLTTALALIEQGAWRYYAY